MDKIIPTSTSDLLSITNIRGGESKFGEKMQTIPFGVDSNLFIESSDASFVLLGIPEDIGVKANFGRIGASSAWDNALKSIVNIQHNKYCKGNTILILGKLDVSAEMDAAKNLNPNKETDRKKLFKLIECIDKEVTHIISVIIKAGKKPIVIGGGHNNSYGMIKGTALGFGKPINAINFDAHSDFRALEGRHSGNGFSYAFNEGFLKKYFMFGLHESYNSNEILKTLNENKKQLCYNTYDRIAIREKQLFEKELKNAYNFIKTDYFGIEIDLDAIPNIAASAMTISGFSAEQLRQFTSFFGKSEKAVYLHICEGAPTLGEEKNNHLIGKLIGYLVTDFIKSN